jgi:glyoxylase-like metal-dependent hydrolase (beta-lactamase superfamily II)
MAATGKKSASHFLGRNVIMIKPSTRREVLKLAGSTAALATLGSTAPEVANAAAPMMGVKRPDMYRFKLGSFEVTTFLDGYLQAPSLHPTYGNDQPIEAVQALAKANGLPMKFETPYVPTLVNTGKELVLFDAGNLAGRSPTTGKLLELLVTAGYKPEQIDVVVITHGHVDHIGGLMRDDKPTYPNARIVFGEVEFDFWKKGEVREARKQNLEVFRKIALPFAEKATFLKPEGEVVSGIRAVNAYGHSPGMMAYHVESEGQRLLIWADVANNYVVPIQKPEWAVSFDDIKDMAAATRKRVFDMVATDKIPVVGFHLPFPSVGFVEKSSAGYRWDPAGYQFNL